MTHAELQQSLAVYRGLRGAERDEVDRHVAGCAECTGLLNQYRAMDRDLSALRDARPDSRLRQGFYAAIGASRDATSAAPAPRFRRLALGAPLAAVALLAAIAGVWVLSQGRPSAGILSAGRPLSGGVATTTPVSTATLVPTSEPAAQQATPDLTAFRLAVFEQPATGDAALTVRLRGTLEGGPDNSRDLYCAESEWDFGDGQAMQRQPSCVAWTPEVTIQRVFEAEHTYADSGVYTVGLSVYAGLTVLSSDVVVTVTGPGSSVPTGWQTYADPALGFSLAHPPEWVLTQDTGLSRLFHRAPVDENNPAFPVFYVSLLPAGYTNDRFEAYNFWSEAEVAVARSLEVGASGDIHGPAGYSTYTRQPDLEVDQMTGVVLESQRVWDGQEGTRDRRVLLRAGNDTYVLGTYYRTGDELVQFEQALATLRLTARPAALRDWETTHITLDMFSGRPNPSWRLSGEQDAELRALLDQLQDAPCRPLALPLGYRGYVVELAQRPELSNEYRLRVAAGQVRFGDPNNLDAVASCLSDPDRTVERFLLQSSRDQVDPETYRQAAEAAGLSDGAFLQWHAAGAGQCREALIGSTEIRYGPCDAATESAPLAEAIRFDLDGRSLAEYLRETFAPFSAETVRGSVVFTGAGSTVATPAQQRAIAEWAAARYEQASAGHASAVDGRQLYWTQQGGELCGSLWVYATGFAVAWDCSGNQVIATGFLSAERLEQFYGWLDSNRTWSSSRTIPSEGAGLAGQVSLELGLAGPGREVSRQEEDVLLNWAGALYRELTE